LSSPATSSWLGRRYNVDESLIDELADNADIPEDDVVEPQEGAEEDEQGISDEDVIAALNDPSEAVRAALQGIVNEAVKRALAKNAPKRSKVRVDPITKEQFDAMSYAERNELYNSNRTLYDKLKG
jgi:hypothetical protein